MGQNCFLVYAISVTDVQDLASKRIGQGKLPMAQFL